MDPMFETQLKMFIEGAQAKIDAYMKANFPTLPVEKLVAEPGSRYVRIMKRRPDEKSGSAYCFVDKTNGNVLKAASWKAPAKGARGNIFNEDNGLNGVGVHGANYLR